MRAHAKASSAGSVQGRAIGLAVFALFAFCAFLSPASSAAAGSANTASCPLATEASPGFRPYLPDCRAYEMITPPFMGGFPPFTNGVLPTRLSEYDSHSFLFNNFGVFAGAPNSVPDPVDFSGTLYLADRETDGWRTFSPMPPLDFEVDIFDAALRAGVIPSADNSTLAWRMRDTVEPESRMSLYLREGSGPFQLVGPITDKPGPGPIPQTIEPLVLGEYAAADLSRIPLRATNPFGGTNEWLWEGDTTFEGMPTLYEYDLSEPGVGSTASEPKLVGVKNEGRLASNTEAELISECGIVLGGGGIFQSGRIDRSVSEDGKYLFFTAERGCASTVQPPIKELYARIDGEETVAISNPLPSDCAACLNETTTPTRQEAAETAENLQVFFQGASKDGAKVFFTSFQQLFPGIFATGNQPHLYRFDFEAPAGQRLELVSKVASGSAEMSNPPIKYTGISEDGERAYFVAKKVLATNESAAYDPVTEDNQVAEQGKFNLYAWEAPKEGNEAQIKFIAQLPAGNLNPLATPDGRFIVFSSTARLVESNESTVAQLFEYDAVSGALVRVSVGDQGFNDNGNTSTNPPNTQAGEFFVSADGRRVFFQSSNALTPGAFNDPTNKFRNLYEWTWSGNQPSEAEARVFPILPAPAQNGELSVANLKGIDPTGENVYFETIGKLVPQHVSGQRAVYTARVNGGFPGLAEEQSCDGDACQGLPSTAPGESPLSSATLLGPGNATNQRKSTRRRCPNGKRKARKAGNPARCAPKQSKRNRRQSNHKRRAGR